MKDHLDALDKRELKTTGWLTKPLDNVEHDFVTPLQQMYLTDLKERIANNDDEDFGFAANIRKCVRVTDAEELINNQYSKINSLKDEAKNIEGKLEKERSQREHLKKVTVLI